MVSRIRRQPAAPKAAREEIDDEYTDRNCKRSL